MASGLSFSSPALAQQLPSLGRILVAHQVAHVQRVRGQRIAHRLAVPGRVVSLDGVQIGVRSFERIGRHRVALQLRQPAARGWRRYRVKRPRFALRAVQIGNPPSSFCIPCSRSISRFTAASISAGGGRPSAWKAVSTSRRAATLRMREASCSEHSKGYCTEVQERIGERLERSGRRSDLKPTELRIDAGGCDHRLRDRPSSSVPYVAKASVVAGV